MAEIKIGNYNVFYNEKQAEETFKKHKKLIVSKKIKEYMLLYGTRIIGFFLMVSFLYHISLIPEGPLLMSHVIPVLLTFLLLICDMLIYLNLEKILKKINGNNPEDSFVYQFYKFTNNKKTEAILYLDSEDLIRIIASDKNGDIHRKHLNLTRKENIKITEITINLNTGCLLLPYKNSESEINLDRSSFTIKENSDDNFR